MPLRPTPDECRQILTYFTRDLLLEKPTNVLAYMEQWAGSHIKRSTDGLTVAESGTLVRLRSEMESLQATMQKRVRYYRDIVDGCQYHLMMTLEDSEGDIFQIQALDGRLRKAKEALVAAQEQHEAVEHTMESSLEALELESEKSCKMHQLYRRHFYDWQKDIQISPRSRVKILDETPSDP